MTHSAKDNGAAQRRHTWPDQAGSGRPEDLVPAPEHGPPYSEDFLAHLHGGMYEDLPEHAALWDGVRADPHATRLLAALDAVTTQIQTLGQELSPCPELRSTGAWTAPIGDRPQGNQ